MSGREDFRREDIWKIKLQTLYEETG